MRYGNIFGFVFSLLFSITSLAGVVNMLDYLSSHVDPIPRDKLETQIDPYNRETHFGPWVKGLNPAHTCQDTRAIVLTRDADSSTKITYHDSSSCLVTKGLWDDPYTGTEFKVASAVQIDHVVPLKNAYLSGAYKWESARRCTYANFISDTYHLLSVSGHENMKKGDHGPEGYLPPSDDFVCHYLNIWMKIKTEWELSVASDELAAIRTTLKDKNCQQSDEEIDQSELDDIRAKSKVAIEKCVDF